MNNRRRILYALYAEELLEKRCWSEEWLLDRGEDNAGLFSVIKQIAAESPEIFKNMMRMDLKTFRKLVKTISPLIKKKDTNYRRAITVEERLAVTLRFLSTGESMMSLHYQFRIGRSTISEIIYETLNAILTTLKDKYLKCPSTKDQWQEIADNFSRRWDMPNVFGAMGGKHIIVNHARAMGSMYRNHKETCSLILIALVDSAHRFLYIDVDVNGRLSDGEAFNDCSLIRNLEDVNNPLEIPPPKPLPGRKLDTPHVILANATFPLKSYLLTPYDEDTLEEKEQIFNFRQSMGIIAVDNTFDLLTARFKILLNRINLDPKKVNLIVWVCCILHNMLTLPSFDISATPIMETELSNLDILPDNRYSTTALHVRDEFAEYLSAEEMKS